MREKANTGDKRQQTKAIYEVIEQGSKAENYSKLQKSTANQSGFVGNDDENYSLEKQGDCKRYHGKKCGMRHWR